MNFIKIKIGSDFEEEFQKAVDEVFNMVLPSYRHFAGTWKPNIDVYESLEEIVILADAAGINKEDIHIEIDSKKIKISGMRKAVQIFKNARYCQAEIPHGQFERYIPLPPSADAGSASASYADGIIIIRINKLPSGKAHRTSVKAGQ